MANNRLYIVDTDQEEYICLATGHGCGWRLSDVEILQKFLDDRTGDGDDKSHLILGHENDDEFWDKYITKYKYYGQV